MASKMLDETLTEISEKFSSATAKPQVFLRVEDDLISKLRLIIKNVYDTGKRNEPPATTSNSNTIAKTLALPELIVDGFDDEQIWQELELQNQTFYEQSVKAISRLASKKDSLTFVKKIEDKKTDQTLKNGVAQNSDVDEEEEEDDDSVVSDLDLGADLDASDESGSEDELAFGEAEVGDEDYDDDLPSPDEGIDDENPEEDDDEEEEGLFNMESKKAPSGAVKSSKPSIVDDEFFRLGDLEQFLNQEDRREDKRRDGKEDDENDEEQVDHFEGFESEEEENDEGVDAMYADFFDVPEHRKGQKRKETRIVDEPSDDLQSSSKKVKFSLDSGSDSQQQSTEAKSAFEERQERLASQITRLENEALSSKPWQLTGEIAAESRPENALLEEDLQFDHTTRAAPLITEETTKTLEDIIRQRIKDSAWDDVERKIKPVNAPAEYKKQLVLDSDKPKQGLAELYEEEYQKLQAKQAGNVAEGETSTKEHEEIKKLTREVFAQLDALANFHYTPKMPSAEVRIVSNLPSLSKEEAVPLAVSDAQTLAPEEVATRPRGDVKSKSERTVTDMKRERRLKKNFQSAKFAAAAQKSNTDPSQALRQLDHAQKTGKVTKMTEVQNGSQKPLRSSTAFFAQLQDQVSQAVKGGGAKQATSKTKKKEQKNLNSVRLKL